MGDLGDIRRTAQDGMTGEQALALIKRCETAEANVAYALPALQRVDAERLELLERVERAEQDVAQERAYLRRIQDEHARIGYADVHARMERAEAVVSIARAWADAIDRQDVGEIERCEGELIVAIARCEQ